MPGVKQVGTAEYDPSTPGSSTSDVDLEESDVEEVQSENKGKGKRKAEDDGKQRQKKKMRQKGFIHKLCRSHGKISRSPKPANGNAQQKPIAHREFAY